MEETKYIPVEYKELTLDMRIRDIEDGDCYYEGVITKIYNNQYDQPTFDYKLERVFWNGDEEDDERIGTEIERECWLIEKEVSQEEYEDKLTQDYLDKMGPTYHMTLLHHHNITAKLNNITDPISDDTLITFTNADGSEYNIHWKTLNERAQAEQALFIQQNGDRQ